MARRILLHVGTPKTGTSALQEVLFQNRERLAEHGVLYPADRFDAHFLAALDLMRLRWGGLETQAVGSWERLAAQVREHEGTAIISHEILATATRSQIDRALASLQDQTGATEIHVLISARDLARQIPAEWQENVKHRAELGFSDFLRRIREPERSSRIGSWFWGVQDLPDILDRWACQLPAAQVHVITVPAPGAPREELWRRFSHAFGLDDLDLDLAVERSNVSLGVAETALIRRINAVAARDLAPADYRPLVRELLAHQTLARRTSSPRLALPAAEHEWIATLAGQWIEELAARGYQVVGDLEDLRGAPAPPPGAAVSDVDRPDPADVAEAGVAAVRALLVEATQRQREIERLRAELGRARQDLAEAEKPLRLKAMERTVQRLETSGGGRKALEVYRTVRGRNSRDA